jgi:hypothetical protein
MITYNGEIVINRPVAEVFDFATTFENFPRWSDVTTVKRLSNGPVGLGTRLQLEMGKGPMKSQIDFETIGWEKDRNWTFRTVSASPIVWDGMFGFEPLGPESTHVRAAGQVTLKGLRKLLEPLVRGELRKNEQAELETLKGILESQDTR